FRLIVCACLLVAIPTVLKFVPGRSPRSATDSAAATGSGDADERIRSGRNERRSLRWAGRRAGDGLGLVVMLSPFLVCMVVVGRIIWVGPGEGGARAPLFTAAMQVSAVIGRFIAGSVADSFPPFALNVLGLALAAMGLFCAVVLYGGFLFVAMLIIG